jgi:hypothetical protein
MGRLSRHARYLATDEHLVLEVHHHPAVLLGPLAAALAAIVAGALIGIALSPDNGSDPIDTLVGLVAAAFWLRLGWKLWAWREDRIIVTTERVVEVSGVLTRRVASMPLAKVTDMTYRRSVLGRLLGFGDLNLESAGQQQALSRIAYLPNPDHFYRTVTSLITAPQKVLAADEEGDSASHSTDADDTGPLPRVIV